MNQEIKTKWIEALRSDNYKQGRTRLRSPRDEFCCLGVLCDIMAPDGWGQNVKENHFGHSSVPEPGLIEQAELLGHEVEKLMHMNDGLQFNFSQIADYIEERL